MVNLCQKRARRASRWNALAGITATVLVVSITAAIFHGGDNSTAPIDRVFQAVTAATGDGLMVINGAALALPGPASNARIYLVSTIPKPRPPESG